MNFKIKSEPRLFSPVDGLKIKDYGEIIFSNDEQITLKSEEGKSHDVTRKEWGWYLSNSVNASLKKQGYKTAVVMSLIAGEPRIFVNVVEKDKLDIFYKYLEENETKIICWLDEWANTA
ncbi:hypothetical protein [Maridesulfovibrio zosterae]|uniref:hypothetical protein n=1 Tax=Maridesulfovibrio zosterae TaxID=82171 RepID=UPI0003FA03C3|nr:hypothetical protein [Maridesulfovibrio zosterae]